MLLWEWLSTPIDPARAHSVGALVSWHGRGIALAWGVMIPTGVVIARYFKVLPWQDWPRQLDNRVWWRAHLGLQLGGFAIALLALLAIIVAQGGVTARMTHSVLGWLVMGLATAQVLSGYLRGTKGGPTDAAPDGTWHGDHYDMTQRRLIFELVHKSLGHGAILAAAAALLAGLWLANAPRWMWIAQLVYWAALAVLALWYERRGPRPTTHEAIWGPKAPKEADRTADRAALRSVQPPRE